MSNREAQLADIAKEQRATRKRMRVGMIAGFSGGVGLALYILQKIFSGLTSSETTNELIDGICLTLMAYTAAIFLVFLFRRGWLLGVNMLLLYVIVPAVLLKLFSDYNM